MPPIGSVFLGDFHRHRLLSSSTPPSSPPPSSMSSVFPGFPPQSPPQSPPSVQPETTTSVSKPTSDPIPAPAAIEPVVSLELRLRWLEAILLGVRQESKDRKGKEKAHELKNGETLIRAADDLQRRLDGIVEGNEGLKKFMDHCPYIFR